VRGAPEHGKRRSVRAGKKRMIAAMRGGGEWEQEKHGDRISARGAWGQKEQEERERSKHWLKQIQNTRTKLLTQKIMNVYKHWRKATRRYALNDLNRA
jgi:hypothetical protein